MPKARSRARAVGAGPGRALDWLRGTWRTEGELVALPPGPPTALIAVDRYEWIPGVELLAHYVSGHLGRESVASFEVWAYDRRRRRYVSTSFDARGVTSTFEARLRGRQWTVQGETQRFRGTFSADADMLSGVWEQKARSAWKPWMAVTLHRVGA